MIKEIFEIEPIQKNSLIMFLGVFCLCFLQIFIFKRKVLEEDAFISIGLTLGLSVCWVVVQLPGFYTFFINTQIGIENKKEEDLMYERIALGFGLMLLFWMTLEFIHIKQLILNQPYKF